MPAPAPIISKNIRVRHPEHFTVGEGSIVDDFSYFSTRVVVGCYSHIAACCTIAGGGDRTFTLGDYCSVSSGARIWCTSDDFVNDVVCILPPHAEGVKENLMAGDVSMADFTAVGSNTVVLPGNRIPEGSVIGAMSFVPFEFPFEPWSVYAGVPIRKICPRNRASVERQVERLRAQLRARQGGRDG